jgi:hypothetical protein
MRGKWRGGAGLPRLRLGMALAVGLVLVGGCGRGEEGAELEGEALEPRIVTEGPVDAPGRPEGRGEVAALELAEEEEEGARWVPELAVSDLAASAEFYRGLGFASAAEGEGADRVELERDGVRLVLVSAEPAAEGEGEAVETPRAEPVLRLVEDGGGGEREVRDPDGHRLVVPGGG